MKIITQKERDSGKMVATEVALQRLIKLRGSSKSANAMT
jgi:hypothetical protein